MKTDAPSASQTGQLLALWKDVFGEHNGFWEMFLETAFLPEHCRCMESEGQITSALYWFDCTVETCRLAYVYAVVTHPEYRGQGLCRKLMENTHAHLLSLGYDGVVLVPEKESLRQMYGKMGYETCSWVSEFSCGTAEDSISLRAIGAEEYAKLRREFLPEGGVVQEKENLVFLARQAEFYTGTDFLLAAYREDSVLHGLEFLGNRDIAPAIVKALNCDRGSFRAPGTDMAFAMFHPLTANCTRPGYFGFAFD